MRRVLVAVLAFASLLALSPVVADAGPTKSVSYTLKGTAVWGADFLPPSFAIHGDVYDGKARIGTYSGTLDAGTWGSYTPCTEGPACAPVTGTITFAVKGGSFTTEVQPGSRAIHFFTGASHETYGFDPLILSITGGTHAYARASGTLSLEYTTDRFQQEITPTGYCSPLSTCPIGDTGTLTGEIAR
jgi:hypothetical protein